MGLVAARDLANSKVVDRVVIGDVDPSRAEKMAEETGHSKVSSVRVDATKHDDLVRAIRRSNVLINAVWYEHNLRVMKAALDARVHYNDLGGLFHTTRAQLELDDEARQSSLTMVLGGGESPGITNVMCARSAEKLDYVEEIRIRVGGVEETDSASDRLVFPFAISTIFDEYSKSPVMFLNGRFEEVEPLSGEEEVEFPPPIGLNHCHYSLHSEIATLPLSFKGVRHVDFKLGISERIFQAVKPLIDAGLDDPMPIEVKGQKVSPRDFSIAFLSSRASDEDPSRYVALRTEVTGVKEGRRLRHIQVLLGQPSQALGVRNATGLLTGIGASIVAQLILEGEIAKKGALAPEVCVPPAAMMAELERRGIKLATDETQFLN